MQEKGLFMLRTGLLCLFQALLFAVPVSEGAVSDKGYIEAIRRGIEWLTRANDEWSIQGFEKAREIFERCTELAPGDYRGYYWKGVAFFHEAVFYLHAREENRDVRKGERAVRRGLKALSRSIKRRKDFSESYALRGVLRGMRIKQNAWTIPVNGPGVRSDRQRALDLDSRNPRVHYLTGISFWMAPEILGGSNRALEHFLKAERLFEEEAGRRSSSLEPAWGRSTCLAFTGNYFLDRGEREKAEAYYRKSLRVNPNDPLARKGLEKIATKRG